MSEPDKVNVPVYTRDPGLFAEVGDVETLQFYDGPLVEAVCVRHEGVTFVELRMNEAAVETDGAGTFYVRLTRADVAILHAMAEADHGK